MSHYLQLTAGRQHHCLSVFHSDQTRMYRKFWVILSYFLWMGRIQNTICSELFEYWIPKTDMYLIISVKKTFFILLNLWQNEIREIWFFDFTPKWRFMKILKVFCILLQVFGYSNMRKLQMDQIIIVLFSLNYLYTE